jgi:hypothetical protein
MNTFLVGIILLLLVGVGIYVLTLVTRLVKAVEVIADRLDG